MHKTITALIGAAMLCVPVAASATAAQAAPAQAPDPAKLAEARAIIEIMFPPAQREQMLAKMSDDIAAPIRQSLPSNLVDDAGLKTLMDSALNDLQAKQRPMMMKHMPALFEAMANAYTREFSLAELKDVRAFAQSPSGQRYLSRSPALLGDPEITKVNAAIFAESQALVQTEMVGLKAKLIAYFEQHPDVAEKVAALAKPKEDK